MLLVFIARFIMSAVYLFIVRGDIVFLLDLKRVVVIGILTI